MAYMAGTETTVTQMHKMDDYSSKRKKKSTKWFTKNENLQVIIKFGTILDTQLLNCLCNILFDVNS